MSSQVRSSRFLLTARLRLQTSWASWRRSRATKALDREEQRTVLLQQLVDSSLLRQKELGQEILRQEHRLQEMGESREFRQTGQLPLSLPSPLPELPQTPPPTHLDLLLSRSESTQP